MFQQASKQATLMLAWQQGNLPFFAYDHPFCNILAGDMILSVCSVESMTVNPMNSLPVGMVFNPKLLQNDKARQVLYGMG